jgi:hypothetical protein
MPGEIYALSCSPLKFVSQSARRFEGTMGEVFECNTNSAPSAPDHCSHALLDSTQGKPYMRRVQADSDSDSQGRIGPPGPGGASLYDLVWRYYPTKLEIEQEDWGPKHKAWEQKTADFVKKNPTHFSQLNADRFMSNVADAAFDLGTEKLFDNFLENVNKDLKGAYKLSLRPDHQLYAQASANAMLSRAELPDFVGYVDLKDKKGKVLGSIPISHIPSGSRIEV